MTDTGNWQSLLGGGRGQQRTGTAEENPFQFPVPQLIQKVTAEGDGTAAAAGTAGVDILHGVVKDKSTAISEPSTEG